MIQTFHFTNQQSVYNGKVRDVYSIGNKHLVMVVSDRVSAFDVVLPRLIPYKGQVLNQMAAYFLDATKHIVPNWVLAVPDANATVGLRCKPFKIEMVVRGYLAGHAARVYKSGLRTICGVALPDGLRENDRLPNPIITPTTKADAGHDADISKDEIIAKGLASKDEYEQVENYTLALYEHGVKMAAQKGLLLVDTKYEFGSLDDKILLMDEIHTPDSSRYFYADGYEQRQMAGHAQKQLSKEFLRQWLIQNGFQGLEGQQVPLMTDEIVNEISNRYIELYESITGLQFVKADNTNMQLRIESAVNKYLACL
ncbi:MAG: phosphoribosylaminoimidazolesuccinocarboxamide synthase [Bacteroidia bacterium]|nr:phosphoribosylaminoimidazolesuccinocarboxamide synthase [Bacteroidia bacterium]